MNKKLVGLIIAVFAVFGLSGCGGGSDNDHPSNLTTLFLVDQNGFSYGGIPYKCESMFSWDTTPDNGEFSFYPGEDCQFDFLGLNGDYDDHPLVDDIVRIVDYTDSGKGDIRYACVSFGASSTFGDGSFYYDANDECVFYL